VSRRAALAEEVAAKLRYFEGHSDTLGLFADTGFLARVGAALAELELQRHVIEAGDRVLVVDDWAETGSKALAARELIEVCGGVYAGLSLLVNQLPAEVQSRLEPVEFVVRAEDVSG
jgi:hypothetical protein